jgi:hypothetical protein
VIAFGLPALNWLAQSSQLTGDERLSQHRLLKAAHVSGQDIQTLRIAGNAPVCENCLTKMEGNAFHFIADLDETLSL